MTSEDEGLGDDSRRDLSSGPSSLADMQECEYDVISEKSSQITDENEINVSIKRNVCLQTDSGMFECQMPAIDTNGDSIERLEKKLKQMKEEKAGLEEQVLELEEAENDARLMSQRLQQQLKAFVDQYESLQLDLINANNTIELNNKTIENFHKNESKLRTQMDEIRSTLLKQSLIECNYYRNEHNFLDESNKKYSFGRLDILDNENINCDQSKPSIDSLYSFLWEKLYQIEAQIDSLQQSYGQTLDSFDSNQTDEDLQLFISTETLSEDLSKIGSSFDVSQFHSYGHFDDRPDPLMSTPLCETVKPEKIDISLANYWSSKAPNSLNQCLPPEMMNEICKLDTNDQILRQRLVQLEWINKQFVTELELREQVFFERENHQKEWIGTETQFLHQINEIKTEINCFRDKSIELKDRINYFNSKIKLFYSENDQKTTQIEKQCNQQKNCVFCLENYSKEIDNYFNEYLSRMQSFKETSPSSTDEQNSFENSERFSDQVKKHYEMLSKFKENLSHKLNDCIDCHKRSKSQLKQEVEDIESKKTQLMDKLKEYSEKENLLIQSLEEKENEWKKVFDLI